MQNEREHLPPFSLDDDFIHSCIYHTPITRATAINAGVAKNGTLWMWTSSLRPLASLWKVESDEWKRHMPAFSICSELARWRLAER